MTLLLPDTRSLATLEARVGQLYPAILLARPVSLRTSDFGPHPLTGADLA